MKRKLLFLGCNDSQIPYIKAINKKDWEIIGADLNKNAPGAVICDKFYNVGYDDFDGLLQIGKKEGFTENDMVFTAAAQFAHKGAARFANFFNIPYVSEKAIDFCLDKAAYYDFFQKNKIPIPKTWYLKSKSDLIDLMSIVNLNKYYYLKSDYSKNPNYVYRFKADLMNIDDFFWGRDRYLKELYILQEEFSGVSLRINIYSDRFNVIDFLSGNMVYCYHEQLNNLNVISTLRKCMKNIGIQDWLIKFDVILKDDQYVVLDIGMDPPFRMNSHAKQKEINFSKHYINQYLYKKIDYPLSLD